MSHLSAKWSNNKTKQFSDEFDVHYSRENNPWIGGVQAYTSSKALFPKNVRQERVLFRSGNMEAGHDWLGVRDFLLKLAGPSLQGKVNQLKLSWRIVIG